MKKKNQALDPDPIDHPGDFSASASALPSGRMPTTSEPRMRLIDPIRPLAEAGSGCRA
jgi:hypothetical protein